jgi:hypothetical protein
MPMINKHRTPAVKNKKQLTPIVAPQKATQTNNAAVKNEKQNATTEIKTQNSTKTLTPKDLVPKLGINEKMVRIFLRKHYPQTHEKNKPWSISPGLAKRIEKDYKALVKTREAEKKTRIQKDLSGDSQSALTIKAESLATDLSEVNDSEKGQVK